MKRVKTMLLLITFIILTSITFSQTVNDVPIADIDAEYIRIVGSGKIFSSKVNVQLEFGQHDKLFSDNTTVRDENDKPVEFNSMVDALNFMDENGYEFLTAYAITMGNRNVYHYLMRKTEK